MPSVFPPDYQPVLNLYETQSAIELIKYTFSDRLADALNLKRVSAPLVVSPETGLNDNLNGVERPVGFDMPHITGRGEIVQSLAKWKRYALWRYDFYCGKGLYTDMNAIRRDEEPDNLHSIYVDQWDWEKVMAADQRHEAYLIDTVKNIMLALVGTQAALKARFKGLPPMYSSEVSFVHSQELEDRWPELTPEQREQMYVRQHPVTFIIGIGNQLKSGQPHQLRAPDYDDWSLNGDLLLWSDILDRAVELSSMGIRVDPATMEQQLSTAGCQARRQLPFHKLLLDGQLPQTIGGGIGQSRLCLLLLGKAHIGEVQSSVWDRQTEQAFDKQGVTLL
ncbi:aspartate--ammonia ligase [Oscillospiraceae bacterium HV4-5-C5C]|nr:aspartate--ammonia ligase [Oscillospiraceae bacterium HV4-5-C5C]